MTNPLPQRITDPMWRLWTQRPVSAWKLGGIYAFKPGYHSSRGENEKWWPDNYSIRLTLDQQGPADMAAAIDYTMSDAEMRKRTGYLIDAANNQDPRLYPVREFYGTADGNTVTGRIKDTRTGAYRVSSSDSSHLWHIHISILRAYVDDWSELSGILSVLRGESLSQWRRGNPLLGLRKGDQGEPVEALQTVLHSAGFADEVGDVDGVYGDMTSAGVLAARKSQGSKATSGDAVTPWAYAQILAALAERQGGEQGPPGPKGDKGDPGPAGPTPTHVQITGEVTAFK